MSDLFTRLQAMFEPQAAPEGAFSVTTYATATNLSRNTAKHRLEAAVKRGVLECGTYRVPDARGHVSDQTLYWEKKSG